MLASFRHHRAPVTAVDSRACARRSGRAGAALRPLGRTIDNGLHTRRIDRITSGGGRPSMTPADDRPEEFRPPTALESAVRALGADTVRYLVEYIMLPMRDGIRLATVVFRPRAAGRYPTLLVRSPYAAAIPDRSKPLHTAQFKKNYVLIMQNERGSGWSEGDFGILTTTTADGQDTLDWINAQEWSNGQVGLHGCSSTAENQLKLGAIGHPALRACVPMS